MADAESTAESAKAAVRGVEETHPEYVDFTVDVFPGGLPACLEAILMVADQPQTATELARILALDRNTVEEALQALHDDYEGDESRDIRPRGFELRRTARGWQFASRAAFEPVVSSFVTDGQTARLSQAALEALAIVAYRQPVTRAQVAAIRGVNSDGVIRSLTVRGLIKEDGVAGTFLAKHNIAIFLVLHICISLQRLRCCIINFRIWILFQKIFVVQICRYIQIFPVIHTSSFECLLTETESQRLDQM